MGDKEAKRETRKRQSGRQVETTRVTKSEAKWETKFETK